jgi:hypothetical protein
VEGRKQRGGGLQGKDQRGKTTIHEYLCSYQFKIAKTTASSNKQCGLTTHCYTHGQIEILKIKVTYVKQHLVLCLGNSSFGIVQLVLNVFQQLANVVEVDGAEQVMEKKHELNICAKLDNATDIVL